MQIALSGIDRDAVRAAEIFWVSASAISAEPSRGTTLALMGDRDRATTILDLDYRPTFWRDEAEASAVIGGALELAGTSDTRASSAGRTFEAAANGPPRCGARRPQRARRGGFRV